MLGVLDSAGPRRIRRLRTTRSRLSCDLTAEGPLRLFELLHDTATREQIPFTIAASAHATGTDADVFHLSRAGIPTGVVSIALRYMHSPVEMVQLDDITACAQLIAAFAQALSAETSFTR